MDLATAVHKRYRKGALLFTFFGAEKAHKYSLLRFGCQAVKLLFQAAHFNTVRNLKLNYTGGPMGGFEIDTQTKYEMRRKRRRNRNI